MGAVFEIIQNFTSTAILGVIIVVIGILLIKKSTRQKLISLVTNAFSIGHRKAFKNPEMAESLFDEQIEKLREYIKKAESAVALAGSQIARAQDEKELAEKAKARADKDILKLTQQGNLEEAKRLAEDAGVQTLKINQANEMLLAFQQQFNRANAQKTNLEASMRALKTKKQLTLNDIRSGLIQKELNQSLKEFGDDELNQQLYFLEEYGKDSKYFAKGSEIAYEESDSKKLQDSYKIAEQLNAEDYIQNLLDEENKNGF
ncbi:MAG: hypothetical protein RR533_09955 [Carnobacterium sp.]